MQRQSAKEEEEEEEEDDVMKGYTRAKHTYIEPPKTKL
jgi:hypothetical protein